MASREAPGKKSTKVAGLDISGHWYFTGETRVNITVYAQFKAPYYAYLLWIITNRRSLAVAPISIFQPHPSFGNCACAGKHIWLYRTCYTVYAMANVGDRLMLSALKTDLPCSMDNNVSQKRCLIHVKLTEFCMKTVEHLMESEKV